MFFARLAYGRTVREFVLVNLIAPSLFAIAWFGVFGSSAIYLDMFKSATISADMASGGNEVALFSLLKNFPLTVLFQLAGLIMIIASFVTAAHSIVSTLSNMTTKDFGIEGEVQKSLEAPGAMKIFWGVTMGIGAWVLLMTGGIAGLQTAMVVCGLPVLILMLLMVVSMIKWFKDEKRHNIYYSGQDADKER